MVKHLHSSIFSLLDKVFSALNLLLYPWNLVQFDGIKKSSNPQRAHLSRVLHWLAASAYFCRTAGLPSYANIAASSCAQFDNFQSHRVFSAFHPLLRIYLLVTRDQLIINADLFRSKQRNVSLRQSEALLWIKLYQKAWSSDRMILERKIL